MLQQQKETNTSTQEECIKLVSGALCESSALVFTKVNGERDNIISISQIRKMRLKIID